jgi:NADPH:quinone reductase-like Zn-dependent oxidoreductase
MSAMSATQELPKEQTAIITAPTASSFRLTISNNVPLPTLAPDQVLVHNVAVALNPCDHKMPDNFPTAGAIDGCDFAGTIIAIGTAVTQPFQIGDRVCGAVHGSNPANHPSGSFAEYVCATADILLKIPNGVSWENATAVGGVALGTLGLAFWEFLELPFDFEHPASKEESLPVLVYGGGTATGTMAIQLLKMYVIPFNHKIFSCPFFPSLCKSFTNSLNRASKYIGVA